MIKHHAPLVPKETLSSLKKAIHRGEPITFDYLCINGKTMVGRTTLPIDIQWPGLTLFGIDENQQENAYKIRYMLNIKIHQKPDDFVSDHYDPTRSSLKSQNAKYPSKHTMYTPKNTVPQAP